MTRFHPGEDRPREGLYRFEGAGETLPYVPLAVRRALDAWGRKLSLEGWLSLTVDDRWSLIRAGVPASLPTEATPAEDAILGGAVPPPVPIARLAEPDAATPPDPVLEALGPSRPLDPNGWRALRPLDRYAMTKLAPKPEKLAALYDEIVGAVRLSHLTGQGSAHMIDVGPKPVTARRAVASALVCTSRAVVEAIAAGGIPKGDVIAVARVAGLLAAKRTPELVPLCHPVQTTSAAIDFQVDASRGELRVRATVEAVDRTGVEMEAMVAASVAALTVYDMVKSADRWARIERVCLEEKSGGKSGEVKRPTEGGAR